MTTEDPAMERAREKAKELREFYGHLVTYVLVNAFLVLIDRLDGVGEDAFLGLDWAYWPIFGWGIGIVVHAANTFFTMRNWEERKVQKLYEKEKDREPFAS
jgi:hypothetical protein